MSDLPPRPTAAPDAASDADLERALADLGRCLDFPPTTDLSARVRDRLASQPARRRGLGERLGARRPRVWAVAAVVLVLLAGGLLLLSPDARRAVAGRLGLPGVEIFHLPPSPPAAIPVTATPLPGLGPPAPPDASPGAASTLTPTGARLGLGERLSALADAQARVAYTVLVPSLSELGSPDEVYLGTPPAGGQLALVYQTRPGLPPPTETGVGLLFTQFRGTLEPAFIGKGLPQGTRVEQLTIAGRPALWIEGRPHFFLYRDQTGRQADERFRLAANVLLWEQGGLTLRLEGSLSKEQALRIAASVR